ncbi:UNVERIFIED_CONTAM: Uridine kinase-like protein 1, chloroplastic [Sesamum radiatum]|uniref:Uridine kinase-like protein 1, chloroplastic n=1 Tax=Sesamum radiatum TaxID=300843 RepID=A0AAW2V575_SESRA
MADESKAIDYVMEASSAPHFSGRRLDSLAAASPSPTPTPSSYPYAIFPPTSSHLSSDSFYRGLTPAELKRVHEYNFDHPDAFDTEQLLECAGKLKSGQSVHIPIYDFKTHQRCSDNFRQIRGMHTLIRDRDISKHDFVFYSDRVIRLVVEHGLGHLPFTEKQVVTPTVPAEVEVTDLSALGTLWGSDAGSVYTGVDFCKKLCGVSIVRSGESMENALRACCKGIKIGKILIHRHGDNGKQLIYEKLPKDICERHVLLLDPVLATGPEGIHCVCKRFPLVKIVTSEIDAGLNGDFQVIPGMGEFGDRYFGTDD